MRRLWTDLGKKRLHLERSDKALINTTYIAVQKNLASLLLSL